jgi:RimJ/RimL family protein N-acetyltransferase
MLELEKPKERLKYKFSGQAQWPRLNIVLGDKHVGHIGWGLGSKLSEGYALGWGIRKDYERKGIMKKALKRFLERSMPKVYQACIMADNVASIALAKSCGFKEIGKREYNETSILVFEYKKD